MSNRTEHIGSRMRLYRKALNYTMDDLAQAICKSKSTISKYECGDVSIDAETLFDIADALHISVSQLMDFCPEEISTPAFSPRGFFSSPGLYYLYHLGSAAHIIRSVLEITSSGDIQQPYAVNFYNDVAGYENLHNCFFFYHGNVSYSDVYVNFTLENQSNHVEKCFITAVNPLSGGNRTMGIVSGISNHYLMPVSYKALFSRQIIKNKSQILDALKFSKQELTHLKKDCMLMLTNVRPSGRDFPDEQADDS